MLFCVLSPLLLTVWSQLVSSAPHTGMEGKEGLNKQMSVFLFLSWEQVA